MKKSPAGLTGGAFFRLFETVEAYQILVIAQR